MVFSHETEQGRNGSSAECVGFGILKSRHVLNGYKDSVPFLETQEAPENMTEALSHRQPLPRGSFCGSIVASEQFRRVRETRGQKMVKEEEQRTLREQLPTAAVRLQGFAFLQPRTRRK